MNREFAPYAPSLYLIELGFDEPCFGYYLCKNSAFGVELELTTNWIDLLPYDSSSCKAPLYQQAFRWFREKYNLDSFVKHLYKSTIKVGYYFGIDQYKGVEFQMDFDAWYKTYEEAELACLIKLIEIVKNK